MPSDRTRTSDDLRQRYKAVVMQQGRVILDRDFNALQEILDGRIAAEALDEIGPCGTPDDGFAISLPGSIASTPFSHSHSTPHLWDFLIAPGTMYVGGHRVVLPPAAANQPAWSYFHQPDWIDPPPMAGSGGDSRSVPPHEYVYLHVSEQEVGAVEDPDLLDVALGGPDTSQRVRLMWRVERIPVDADGCASALSQAMARWASDGYLFDPTTMRLLPQARLQVGFAATPATSSPCDPVAQGGYLGAENQLIRLQIAAPTPSGGSQLLWGYDDASFLYRFTPKPDGKTLVLLQVPVDAYHCPAPNQVVEVLRTAVILGTSPDETDPTGTGRIVRCVAEATGRVATVASYSTGDNTVTLTTQLSPSELNDPNPLFLRIWQGQQSIGPSSQAITLTDATTRTSPGIQVTVAVPPGGPQGAPLPAGAYWMIAVRPSTPQAVYPERYLTGPQPPDGARQWICPLAVIRWFRDDASVPASSGPSDPVTDCRNTFLNLVELSLKRREGCCTVSVAPSDAANLQAILDQAAISGQRVTVCFAAGTYSLDQPLRLSSRHSGLILEACGGGATLEAAPNASMTLFLDGLLVLVQADDVTFRGLEVIAPSVPFQQALAAVGQQDSLATITSTPASFRSIVGIRLFQCLNFRIEGCSVRVTPEANTSAIAAGVHISGDCTGLSIRGCRIASATPPTVNYTAPPSPVVDRTRTTDEAVHVGSIPDPLIESAMMMGTLGATGPAPAASQPAASSPQETPDLITRLSTLAAVASPPVSASQGLVALFGVLALPLKRSVPFGGRVIGSRLVSLPPLLHEAGLIDNDFSNLTLAAWCNVTVGTCRMQDNRATSCVGGLWVEAYDLADPSDATDSRDTLYGILWNYVYACTHAFQEVSVGGVAWQSLPLPSGMSLSAFVALSGQQPAAPPTSLSVTNNHVETSFAGAPLNGGTGLMLLVSRNVVSGQDTSASLVINANQVRGNPDQIGIPLVLLATLGPTAVTGNLIGNVVDSVRSSLSLWIFPGTGPTNVSQLAVTGNVLVGQSNLSMLARSDDANPPLNNWTVLNSSF